MQRGQKEKKKKKPAEKIPSWAFPILLRSGDRILQIILLEGHAWVPKQIRGCHQDQVPVLLISSPCLLTTRAPCDSTMKGTLPSLFQVGGTGRITVQATLPRM